MTTVTDPSATVPPPDKPPRKARKPRASKPPAAPKVERAKRTTPARTLRVRIHDLAGDAGLDAFDLLRKKGGEAYEKSVRDALDASDALRRADTRLVNAQNELAWAREAQADQAKACAQLTPVLDRLLLAAKRVASLDKDDVEADAPTDADRKGVEIP